LLRDEATFRGLVEEILQRAHTSHEVTLLRKRDQAIQAICEQQASPGQPIDVVISDVRLASAMGRMAWRCWQRFSAPAAGSGADDGVRRRREGNDEGIADQQGLRLHLEKNPFQAEGWYRPTSGRSAAAAPGAVSGQQAR
jgi:hypothetical protein